MVHLLVGAIVMAGLLGIISYARHRRLKVTWWQWLLTVSCFFYIVFVLEVIISFIAEGTPKGALVMGLVLGFLAVIWAVLLGRFVFLRSVNK